MFNINDTVFSMYDDKVGIIINIHTELKNEIQPFYDIKWNDGTITTMIAREEIY